MDSFKRAVTVLPKGNFSCNRLHFTLKTNFGGDHAPTGEVLVLTLFQIVDSFPEGTATRTLLSGVISDLISHLKEHEEGFSEAYQALLDTECSSERNFKIFAAVIIGTYIDKYLTVTISGLGEGIVFDDSSKR